MQLYGPAATDELLRHKGMQPPTHTPDADDLRELCGLVACLRAWSHTHGDEADHGREHALYPPRQYRPGVGPYEGPLWQAIERVLTRQGYGRGRP